MSIRDSKKNEIYNLLSLQYFFHDGSIIDIRQDQDTIRISMESAEIIDGDLETANLKWNYPLSKHNRIEGILILEKVTSTYINNQLFTGSMKMLADSAGILYFRLENSKLMLFHKKIKLFVEWINYTHNKELPTQYSDILIKCKKIHWKNAKSYKA